MSVPDHKSPLRQSLESIALLYSNNRLNNFYDFVLRYGREYRGGPLPKSIPRMTPKECFKNATMLSLEQNLQYVEGYVFYHIPIHHAWCIDDQGNVIDPTIINPAECHYMGVAYNQQFLIDYIAQAGYYSIMFNHRGVKLLTLPSEIFLHETWR